MHQESIATFAEMWSAIFLCYIFLLVSSPDPASAIGCYPAIFSFGDSKADTGLVQAAFPFSTNAEFPPYGRTYFGKPANRYSDGRLVIDFHAQAYGYKFLDPYLLSVEADFRRGVNFAASGGTALNSSISNVPFNLGVQLEQFKRFKNLVLAGTDRLVPNVEDFKNGLYVVSIGENDYRAAYQQNLTVEEVKASLVPVVVQGISDKLEALYQEGARNIFVVNYCADGCLPSFLSNYASSPEDVDENGCLISYNSVPEVHNVQLKQSVERLRQQYKDANFIWGDYYGINIEIVTNRKKYGFHVVTTACCGPQVRYRYNKNLLCGGSGVIDGKKYNTVVCSKPANYLSWDGIHLTEHFYRVVAEAFLTGKFVEPHDGLRPNNCTLDFSKF